MHHARAKIMLVNIYGDQLFQLGYLDPLCMCASKVLLNFAGGINISEGVHIFQIFLFKGSKYFDMF